MSLRSLAPSTPIVTPMVIAACVLIALLGPMAPEGLLGRLALWPWGHGFRPWQLLSYAFLHGGLFHLVFNMLALHWFGGDLERVYGPRRLLLLYGAGVLGAALAQLAVDRLQGTEQFTIGASGGVFGLLLAYAVTFPRRKVIPLFPPIPMPAWLFAVLYAALELYLGLSGSLPGIAHFAHLGGLLGAGAVLGVWLFGTRRY